MPTPPAATPEQARPATGGSRRLPAEVRQARLVEEVRARGFISVAEIATALSVSEMTIRRDLDELERDGRLVRTHGGAMAVEEAGENAIDREEPAFESRLRRNQAAKRRIAAFAATRIESGRTVALDVGTTTYLVAEQIAGRSGIKVFTSSLKAGELLGHSACEVYMPGGQIRGDEMSVCGPTAVSQFERLWFDVALIGVSGITAGGIFDYSFDDSEMKRVYLRRATQKILLCDRSKFRRMSLVQVADFRDIDMLVTDMEPPADIAAALEAAKVDVRVVPEASE